MGLSYDELAEMLAGVGVRQGWDFSCMQDARDPTPWHYVTLVRGYLKASDRVLDVGTGGGERFLELAPSFHRGVGTDISPTMIGQARRNLRAAGPEPAYPRVGFAVMGAAALGLRDGAFDVVLNRHATVEVEEVVRMLRPGGVFITQQVARRNTLNVLAAFGWTPESFGPGWFQPVAQLAADFEALGCRVEGVGAYDVRYWFLDVPSLLFWLTAVPLPEPFDLHRHWEGVNRLIASATTSRGIETNEHRELLVVRKSG